MFALERVAAGCWRIGPGIHETLWITADELPLRRDLVPFAGGAIGSRAGYKELDMSAETVSDIIEVPADDEAQNRIKAEFTHKLLAICPDADVEAFEKGIERMLASQFERRLARAVTAKEHDVFVERIHRLGPSRLGDVVIDLSPVELVEWLRDPDAR